MVSIPIMVPDTAVVLVLDEESPELESLLPLLLVGSEMAFVAEPLISPVLIICELPSAYIPMMVLFSAYPEKLRLIPLESGS